MSGEGSDLSLLLPEGGESWVSSGKRGHSYVRGEKSGKWSVEEHMKYIAFIDFHKDRMRSRDKRRTNKFYQEMADFLITRNALQCRSHHQKLEEKYTHAHKIVNFFKPTFDKLAYRDALLALHALPRQDALPKAAMSGAASRSVETQTEIGGVDLEFIGVSPHCYLIQSPAHRTRPPPFYYHPFLLGPHAPTTTTTTLASTEGIVSPVTWEGHNFSHDFGSHPL
jgi:hypothetical protein